MSHLRLRKSRRLSRPTRGRRHPTATRDLTDPPTQTPRQTPARPALRFLPEMYQVNERFLERLQQLAREDRPTALGWVAELREVLLAMTPDARARAARRSFLLVDMEFGNAAFWHHITSRRTRSEPTAARPEVFPRATAVELARAALTLAWHAVRQDRLAAIVCFGMAPGIRELIRDLTLTDIDRIASQHCHDLRPRWEDLLEEWRRLVIDGQSRDLRRAHAVNLRGIQLITGALMAAMTPKPSAANGAHSEGGQSDSEAQERQKIASRRKH